MAQISQYSVNWFCDKWKMWNSQVQSFTASTVKCETPSYLGEQPNS